MEDIQDKELSSETTLPSRRRKLLPWWIKVFIWIFFLFAALAPVGIILGLAGYTFPIALYGLETNEPFSVAGWVLILIFIGKGVVAFGLWMGKDWVINIAQIDAIIGLAICVIVSFDSSLLGEVGVRPGFRLEIFLLIPYLIKVRNLKGTW